MLVEYGYTSKIYPFGSVAGSGSALPVSVPTKMMVTAKYTVAPGERIKIKIWNGKVDGGGNNVYQTVLDFARDLSGTPSGGNIISLDTELALGADAPTSLPNWGTIIKASITADDATDTLYNATERVDLYFVRNTRTGVPEVRFAPTQVTGTEILKVSTVPPPPMLPSSNTIYPAGTVVSFQPTAKDQAAPWWNPPKVPTTPTGPVTDSYVALKGVQVAFFGKGTDITFLTSVSDENGRAGGFVPPGSYDVKIYGSGFTPAQWLTGSSAISVGSSDVVTRFGDNGDDVQQAAEFGTVKTTFASSQWIGYMIVEDFTSAREVYRNELADPGNTFTEPAIYAYGRIYRGQSWIDFIGVGIDPAPV